MAPSSLDPSTSDMRMAPPPVPPPRVAAADSSASTSPSSTSPPPPAKKEKRKLACAACRARRIRCEWADGGSGCVACMLAELKCPGEPEPRKRQKKADGSAAPAPVATTQPTTSTAPSSSTINIPPDASPFFTHQLEPDRYELGGALTFHLIELAFTMANPCIPGLEYDLYRMLLNNAGGTSREMEIAAESLCMAFIASAVTFSDHQLFVGPGPKSTIPFEEPSGIKASIAQYDKLVTFGSRRRDAVDHFAQRSLKLFAESSIKDYPGIETIYTMLAMDHSLSLTTDGGRKQRDFIEGAIWHYKHLVERIAEMPSNQVEALMGPISNTLLNLDAHTAAVLRRPLAISTSDLETYFPQYEFDHLPPPLFDPQLLFERKEGWTQLGKQLAPLQTTLTRLYREFVSNGTDLGPYISQLWHSLDSILAQLDLCDTTLGTLPPLETKEATNERQFDFFSLTNLYRRDVMRLDLLVHQRIVDAASLDPTPIVLEHYSISHARVQKVFKLVSVMAKEINRTSALVQARRLFEMLEVCLTWSSMRNSQPRDAAVLVQELGITKETGSILMNCLALTAWSSSLADIQRVSLRAGLNHIANPMGDKSDRLAPVPPPSSDKVTKKVLTNKKAPAMSSTSSAPASAPTPADMSTHAISAASTPAPSSFAPSPTPMMDHVFPSASQASYGYSSYQPMDASTGMPQQFVRSNGLLNAQGLVAPSSSPFYSTTGFGDPASTNPAFFTPSTSAGMYYTPQNSTFASAPNYPNPAFNISNPSSSDFSPLINPSSDPSLFSSFGPTNGAFPNFINAASQEAFANAADPATLLAMGYSLDPNLFVGTGMNGWAGGGSGAQQTGWVTGGVGAVEERNKTGMGA